MNDICLMLADKTDYFVDGFGNVEPITIKDFMYMPDNYEKFYEDIVLPWRMCWRSFYSEEECENLVLSELVDYDMFFIKFNSGKRMSMSTDNGDVELVTILKKSIDFIFKCNSVIDYNNCLFIIDDTRYICRENYESICNIVLKTNMCKKYEKEKELEFENDRQRDVYYKLQSGRNRATERNRLNIKQILNIVMVYTKYQINDVLKNMTMYQLFNTYSSLSVEDGYKLNLTYVPVVADISKLDLEHWSTKLK